MSKFPRVEAYHQFDFNKLKKQREAITALKANSLFPESFDFPLLLQLELTSSCNVFCKHCYNNSGKDNAVPDAMTPEKWKKFAKYIVSNGGIFECILSGGEPLLLGKDLFDIMDIFHNDGTYFLLITNGFLLTEETVIKLEKYRYKWIQVSIDGYNAEFHDSFRQRKGSWERAVNGAYYLSKHGLPLTIAHSVSPYNLKDVDKMCDLAYSLGAGNIILGEINLSGRTYENNSLVLNDEQREYLLERVEFNMNKFSGKMSIQRSLEDGLQYEANIGVPNGEVIIRPDGNIRLDCMAPFSLGNILTNDFCKVWKSKGINCWDNPVVRNYLNENKNKIKNYIDNDINL